MENASKALIMAAEILIGIMILSAMVYMFNVFAGYSEDRYKEIEDTQVAEFNNRFLKFYGTKKNENGVEKPIECTIHDITSLANFAQKHNIEYEVNENTGYSENTLYVQIDLENKKNLEKCSNSELVKLIKDNDLKLVLDEDIGKEIPKTKYYKCVKCDINNDTGRVNHIVFEEI